MTGNVVISDADALMYVVLSKAEKHMPYGQLVGIRECIALYPMCHTNRSHHNRVQLYFCKINCADNMQMCLHHTTTPMKTARWVVLRS
jgi:hypothetical protein